MNKCLLDTDILSEVIKGRDPAVAAKALAYLGQLGRFTTSAVSVAEIIYGFRRIGREDRVSQFEASLANTEVLPFDAAAARYAGRINADLERNGRTIGMPDVMIAGIALHHALPVVTGTRRTSSIFALQATKPSSKIGAKFDQDPNPVPATAFVIVPKSLS